MIEIFKIGLVVKPQGIRGELKVQPLTDDLSRFKKLKSVLIDGKPFNIDGVKIGVKEVFVALSGVSDRNTAETFRGKFLCVERKDAVKLKKDSYFVSDLINCVVLTDSGVTVGKVVDVISGKTDVISLNTENGKSAMFPFLKDALVGVDVESGVITVKEKRFSEIVLYED